MRARALFLLMAGLLIFTAATPLVHAAGELQVTVTPDKNTLDVGETLYLTVTVTRNNAPHQGAEVFFSRLQSDGSDIAVLSGWQHADSGTIVVAIPTDTLPTGGPIEFYAKARYVFSNIDSGGYSEWTGFGTTTVTINKPPTAFPTRIKNTIAPTIPNTVEQTIPPQSTVTTIPPVPTITQTQCYVGPLPCIWIPIILIVIFVFWVFQPHEPPGSTPEKPSAPKSEKTPGKDTRPKQEDRDKRTEDKERSSPDEQGPQILTLHVNGGIDMKGDTSTLTGLRLNIKGGIDRPEKKTKGGR